MGCNDRYDRDPEWEKQEGRARALHRALQSLGSCRFTVEELGFLLRAGRSQFATGYGKTTLQELERLAQREGVSEFDLRRSTGV